MKNIYMEEADMNKINMERTNMKKINMEKTNMKRTNMKRTNIKKRINVCLTITLLIAICVSNTGASMGASMEASTEASTRVSTEASDVNSSDGNSIAEGNASAGKNASADERAIKREFASADENASAGDRAITGKYASAGKNASADERAIKREYASADENASVGDRATTGENASPGKLENIGVVQKAEKGKSTPVKGGYTLVPTLYGEMGIDVSSSFILSTPEGVNQSDIIRALSIDGQPAPKISQSAEREFLITPVVALSPNSLYIFRLASKDIEEADITWAFQTVKKFQITSSFPGNEATNVPVRSGIEISFSSEGYSPMDDYFSISPNVSGKFEYHKETAVFVPKRLDYATVYTVTIKPGIKLDGTNETLPSEYVFSFETQQKPEDKQPERYDSLEFSATYMELPTIEPPTISYWAYSNRDELDAKTKANASAIARASGKTNDGVSANANASASGNTILKVNVYKFGGVDAAVDAVKKLLSAPRWSICAKEDSYIDTRGLNSIMSLDEDPRNTGMSRYYGANNNLRLPDKLTQGFYLIDATFGDSRSQMIIQISDLPVQAIGAENKSILWVNDFATGKAAAKAKVLDVKEGKTYLTDENGVAVIDGELAKDGRVQFNITSADGKNFVWLYAPAFSPYYYGGYAYNRGRENEAYWTALQMDRTLFKRDDTLFFWGVAEKRSNGAPSGTAAGAAPGEVATGAAPGEVATGAAPGEVATGATTGEVTTGAAFPASASGTTSGTTGGDNASVGVAVNDNAAPDIQNVTVTLTRGYSYMYADYSYGGYGGGYGGYGGYESYGGYGANRDILLRQVVPVRNGVFSDEIRLPNLDVGSYNLTVYHGEIALSSTYFTVWEYTKPQYKVEASADKKAYFMDELATFTLKAGFFEGTPVSDLAISYSFYGYQLQSFERGEGKTNLDGELVLSQKISPWVDAQGETTLILEAEATLPETGDSRVYSSARVFINDVNMNASAKRTRRDAQIDVRVDTITLDRLNNGTAKDRYDYLDKPAAGKALTANVYRVYYVKTEVGEYYDYIEKKTVPRYRYERKEEIIDRLSMITGSDGKASKQFTVPDRENESYFAIISCVDGNFRETSQTVYIGRDYSDYFRNVNSDDYFLYGANDAYNVGENVNLTVKRGADSVTSGNVLFVTMQRGILDYQAGSNPYNFTFSKKHIPNAIVYAYCFDRSGYHSGWAMNKNIMFNYNSNSLELTAVTDKDAYKPGDTCNIIITAKDGNGNPREADVNVSVVDEALFALSDYYVDTLTTLYRSLSSGQTLSSSTHNYYTPSDAAELDSDENDMSMNYLAAPAPMAAMGGEAMEMETPMADEDGGGVDDGGEAYLREVFEDTAIFSTVRTNAKGVAEFSFKLPDNITTWRLTLSGVSIDADDSDDSEVAIVNTAANTVANTAANTVATASIHNIAGGVFAGNVVESIAVTNPMFLSYALNNTFLVGDTPIVGVNVYGTSLSGAETVNFEVWNESAPDEKFTATGVSFERVNVPIGEMKNEGADALIINATVSNGTSDAVRLQYRVLDTYRQIDGASYYDVTTNTAFHVGDGGLTNIMFTDRSRGQYLSQLIGLRYARGDRIERLLAAREANKLLATYFPDLALYGVTNSFNPNQYQRDDGGIAILPYADSDLETTVKLMPYITDEVNTIRLRDYLYSIYEGENADNKMSALYGLAMLKEPILLDLDAYSSLDADSLSVKDAVYIALGYCALGETESASALYDRIVAPKLERIAPYYRVYTGKDNDDVLEATSAAAALAAKLGKPEREGLYQYCIKNYTQDILINLEKLFYISYEIERKTDVTGEITYTLFGEKYTRKLGNGGSYLLRIPAESMGEFKLIEVKGDVGAVSVYKKPLTEVESVDNDITVRRRYYKIGSSSGASGSSGGANSASDNGSGSGSSGNGASNASGSSGASSNASNNASYVFEEGDIVLVQLWIDYSKKAIDGSYCVTDYLPSGLAYVSDSAKIDNIRGIGYGYYRYATIAGQKITFYDYNNKFNKGYLYYYYARVINPGTFKAEGTLVQNLEAKDSFTVGEDSVLEIRATPKL